LLPRLAYGLQNVFLHEHRLGNRVYGVPQSACLVQPPRAGNQVVCVRADCGRVDGHGRTLLQVGVSSWRGEADRDDGGDEHRDVGRALVTTRWLLVAGIAEGDVALWERTQGAAVTAQVYVAAADQPLTSLSESLGVNGFHHGPHRSWH